MGKNKTEQNKKPHTFRNSLVTESHFRGYSCRLKEMHMHNLSVLWEGHFGGLRQRSQKDLCVRQHAKLKHKVGLGSLAGPQGTLDSNTNLYALGLL